MCGVVRESDVVRDVDLRATKLAGLPNVVKVVWPRRMPGVTVEDVSQL